MRSFLPFLKHIYSLIFLVFQQDDIWDSSSSNESIIRHLHLVKVSRYNFELVYCCLYFGCNAVCSEVLHFSFIVHFTLVRYFIFILVFLFHSIVYCEYLVSGSISLSLLQSTHSGFQFLVYVSLICFQFFLFAWHFYSY